jgi:hypothetical protein
MTRRGRWIGADANAALSLSARAQLLADLRVNRDLR